MFFVCAIMSCWILCSISLFRSHKTEECFYCGRTDFVSNLEMGDVWDRLFFTRFSDIGQYDVAYPRKSIKKEFYHYACFERFIEKNNFRPCPCGNGLCRMDEVK